MDFEVDVEDVTIKISFKIINEMKSLTVDILVSGSLKQQLTPNPDYKCAQCMGNACPNDGRPQSEVQVGPDMLEVVASFCYLGAMLSAGGGCEITVTTHVKTAW